MSAAETLVFFVPTAAGADPSSTTTATFLDSATTSASHPRPDGSKRYACSCCDHHGEDPARKRRGRPQKCPTRDFWQWVEANGGVISTKEVRKGRPPVPLPSVEETRGSRQQQDRRGRLENVCDECARLLEKRLENERVSYTPHVVPEDDLVEVSYSTDGSSPQQQEPQPQRQTQQQTQQQPQQEPQQQQPQQRRRTGRLGSDPDCVEMVDLTADDENNPLVELNPSSVLRLLSEESAMLFSPEMPDSFRRASAEAEVAGILLNLSSTSSSEEEEGGERQVWYETVRSSGDEEEFVLPDFPGFENIYTP